MKTPLDASIPEQRAILLRRVRRINLHALELRFNKSNFTLRDAYYTIYQFRLERGRKRLLFTSDKSWDDYWFQANVRMQIGYFTRLGWLTKVSKGVYHVS